MKLLLFTFVLFLSGQVFGQYSRSFFTEELELRRLSSVTEINNELHFFTIRRSTPTSLVIDYGKINTTGETSNYQTIGYTANLGANFVLSGTAQQGTVVTIAIQGDNGSDSQLSYAQLDLSTNTIISYITLPGSYRKGFSRSRMDGNNIITYLVKSVGGLERISTSLSNTSLSNYESVNTTETASVNFITNYKNCELQIENGVECAIVRNNLIKRISSGNFVTTTVTNFFPIGSSSLVVTSTNQIAAFQANEYAIYDLSLNPIASGTFVGSPAISGSQRFYEAYEVNGGFRVFHGSQTGHLTDITSSFTISNTAAFVDLNIFGVNRIGAAIYPFGQRINQAPTISSIGSIFQGNPSSMAIIQDYLNATPTSFKEYAQAMEAGNFSGLIGTLGNGFSNIQLQESSLRFEMNGTKRTLLYSAADFIVGLDNNDSLIGHQNNYSGYGYLLPGPFTNGADYDNELMDYYNRGYYVTQQMITDHASNIASGNINYTIPFAIKYWPAHGDVSKGQAADLASYVDVNNNGIYDPENGDYPAIYGSQCILSIYHQPSFSPNSAQIETHYYTFAFDCDTNETLKNTLFTRSHIFARSQNIYDCYAGKFFDFDIGTSTDDYMGTHVELGLVYGYNGDNYDEQNGQTLGFNDTIPAFGVLTLKGSKRASDGIDNGYGINTGESVNGLGFGDGIIDNEFNTLESSYFFGAGNQIPINLPQMYNVSMGLNPDGSANLAQGTVPTRFTYFGDSDPLYYSTGGITLGSTYSEIAAGNAPGERYTFASTGKSDLLLGDTLVYIDAYLAAVDSVNLGNTALYSVNKLFERAQEVKNFFESGNIGCGYNFNPTTLELPEVVRPSVQLYPNPTNSSLTVNLLNGTEMTTEVRDLNGRLVLNAQKSGATTTLDFSTLENATYLVIVSNELGTTVSRVIKY